MMGAGQLDLLSDVGDARPPERAARARQAAERLAGRIGATLPAAVERALIDPGGPSAIEAIAAHIVRVVDAAAATDGVDWSDPCALDELHRGLPAVDGASGGIARAITAAALAPADG